MLNLKKLSELSFKKKLVVATVIAFILVAMLFFGVSDVTLRDPFNN
jgi:high-affinity Fe2+/Pb2+ permease